LATDGSWRYLDDDRFALWKPVVISAGFSAGAEELISGYITHLKPTFDPDPDRCYIDIWGMDGSVLMDREEKLKDWPNKKESDIASEIFGLYGFTPNVEDTTVTHDEAASTIIQRETDMQFLKRLALRHGFECYVEGLNGYFRPPQVDADPQPLMSIHFGDETNVNTFSLEVNALAPATIVMTQIDRASKEVIDATAEASLLTPLGETDAVGILGAGIPPGLLHVGVNVTTGSAEMTTLCQGLYHQGEWFVTGEGEVNANQYAHVLKPHGTVTIKGIGETHSGIYYVTQVTHKITSNGYTQSFKVKRNALKPSGAEDFAGDSGGLF
jgi:phage protein D